MTAGTEVIHPVWLRVTHWINALAVLVPPKLGYKNPKHIQAIFVTNTYPGGYWEDQGYNWFGGS